MGAILVVEQQPLLRHAVHEGLQRRGYSVAEVRDAGSAERHLAGGEISLAVVGSLESGTRAAIEFADCAHRRYPAIPVVIYAAETSVDLLLGALRAGVRDYISQPSLDELVSAVARCMLPSASRGAECIDGSAIVGCSPAMGRTREYLRKVAATDCNVLITGATGTGKELVAEAIHRTSQRRQKPFVTVNCAAIPDTLLESELFGYERGAFTGAYTSHTGKLAQADGGTILLDEIGEMTPLAQAKILRAIENKEVQRLGARANSAVNVRVVAATNQELDSLMLSGRFRRDLYFRLSVAQIRLPELQERQEDIPVLVEFFLRQFNHRFACTVRGLDSEVMDTLMRHNWPGNVRELRNLVEAFFVNCRDGWVKPCDVPDHFNRLSNRARDLNEDERTRVVRALQNTHWNKSLAARELHWSRMTLYRKMARYEIARPPGRGSRSDAAAGGSGS
jgi:DNA-binding NtrC family response regulator